MALKKPLEKLKESKGTTFVSPKHHGLSVLYGDPAIGNKVAFRPAFLTIGGESRVVGILTTDSKEEIDAVLSVIEREEKAQSQRGFSKALAHCLFSANDKYREFSVEFIGPGTTTLTAGPVNTAGVGGSFGVGVENVKEEDLFSDSEE